jgi:hypothetical protein
VNTKTLKRYRFNVAAVDRKRSFGIVLYINAYSNEQALQIANAIPEEHVVTNTLSHNAHGIAYLSFYTHQTRFKTSDIDSVVEIDTVP